MSANHSAYREYEEQPRRDEGNGNDYVEKSSRKGIHSSQLKAQSFIHIGTV